MYNDVNELYKSNFITAHGRVNRDERGITFFWTGSSLDFVVTGSNLSVEINVPETSLCPWVCIYMNSVLLQRRMLERGTHSVCIYDSLNYSEPKRIRIIKDSPALLQNAVFEGETLYTVKGISTDGDFRPFLSDTAGGSEPCSGCGEGSELTPGSEKPRKRGLRIELIGDSITSGEGLGGYPGLITEDLWFFTAQPQLHYGMYLAEELNADLRIVTQAGWGVYIGYTNMLSYNIPSIYEKVCGVMTSDAAIELGAQKPYDFFSWSSDLVIVNLGTNDAAAFTNPGFTDPDTGMYYKMRKLDDGTLCPEDLDKVSQAVLDFLTVLRAKNPRAYILWCYGMMGHELEQTLSRAVAAFADQKTFYVSLPDTLPGEFGSVDHPGIRSHKKTADTLVSAVRKLPGINIH